MFPTPCSHEICRYVSKVASIIEQLPRLSGLLIGPGLGRSPEAVSLVQSLLGEISKTPIPTVVDAVSAVCRQPRGSVPKMHFYLRTDCTRWRSCTLPYPLFCRQRFWHRMPSNWSGWRWKFWAFILLTRHKMRLALLDAFSVTENCILSEVLWRKDKKHVA